MLVSRQTRLQPLTIAGLILVWSLTAISSQASNRNPMRIDGPEDRLTLQRAREITGRFAPSPENNKRFGDGTYPETPATLSDSFFIGLEILWDYAKAKDPDFKDPMFQLFAMHLPLSDQLMGEPPAFGRIRDPRILEIPDRVLQLTRHEPSRALAHYAKAIYALNFDWELACESAASYNRLDRAYDGPDSLGWMISEWMDDLYSRFDRAILGGVSAVSMFAGQQPGECSDDFASLASSYLAEGEYVRPRDRVVLGADITKTTPGLTRFYCNEDIRHGPSYEVTFWENFKFLSKSPQSRFKESNWRRRFEKRQASFSDESERKRNPPKAKLSINTPPRKTTDIAGFDRCFPIKHFRPFDPSKHTRGRKGERAEPGLHPFATLFDEERMSIVLGDEDGWELGEFVLGMDYFKKLATLGKEKHGMRTVSADSLRLNLEVDGRRICLAIESCKAQIWNNRAKLQGVRGLVLIDDPD